MEWPILRRRGPEGPVGLRPFHLDVSRHHCRSVDAHGSTDLSARAPEISTARMDIPSPPGRVAQADAHLSVELCRPVRPQPGPTNTGGYAPARRLYCRPRVWD